MPYHMLFTTTLVTGTLMALSSNHWIYVWMGFEINLLSFIPIMLHSDKNQETEASIKYFLIQALGSSLILLSSMSILFAPYSIFSPNLMMYMLIFALMVKMGAAPFHFWLPQIMSSISWMSCAILATWQKIAPLFIIVSVTSPLSNKVIMTMAIISTLIGGLGGLNQTHLRALLAYSSIGHLGWMIAGSVISMSITSLYFLIYSLMTLSIMFISYDNTVKSNYMTSISNMSTSLSLSLMILFLSLGGLPPLLGFLPKWMMIKSMIFQNMYLFISIMIISSLISLFYYLSLFFNLFLNQSMKMHENKSAPSMMMNTSIVVTLTLGMVPLIM
uniref:NADH-ubiquinone oxidoreductase chain 2 n=1 Tax=Glycera dibranchiata TaxID=6350 RepID=A0A0S3CQT7_GLYDI|nr:NADH dehydrogenase subunit 2 [Glycera dibranchiata]